MVKKGQNSVYVVIEWPLTQVKKYACACLDLNYFHCNRLNYQKTLVYIVIEQG